MKLFKKFALFYGKIKTYYSIGIINIISVIWYRICKKNGFYHIKESKILKGPFISNLINTDNHIDPIRFWDKGSFYFGYLHQELKYKIPNWYKYPFSDKKFIKTDIVWWKINDFEKTEDDIKLIWELSRFSWTIAFAQKIKNGDENELLRFNNWLTNWCIENKPYYGPNWMCAQEASIRVINILVTILILKQNTHPLEDLVDLIIFHLKRINKTTIYAKAQQNNHGTTEAAALFMGGNWLLTSGIKEGKEYAIKGRRMLENRVNKLIDSEGGFSQYSVNYHRLMIDTLCIVEVWINQYKIDRLSKQFYTKAYLASIWLYHFVSEKNGEVPNIGANDGAYLLHLTNCDYRDYRPSVQLSMALFSNTRAYDSCGLWNNQLKWLDVTIPNKKAKIIQSTDFQKSGFLLLKRKYVSVYMRYPKFKFRPSQSDALHVDLWINGENILRDSGTYSYNTSDEWYRYFNGTSGHNTIQFDNRDQINRISRFIFGPWIKTNEIETIKENKDFSTFTVSYKDNYGATHKRNLTLYDRSMVVRDDVFGFKERAVLRWRLIPGNWKIEKNSVTNGQYSIRFSTTKQINRIEICNGWESRYYYQKTSLPVVEVEIYEPGYIISEINW